MLAYIYPQLRACAGVTRGKIYARCIGLASISRPDSRVVEYKTAQLIKSLENLYQYVKDDPMIISSVNARLDIDKADMKKVTAFDLAVRSFARHPYISVCADNDGLTPIDFSVNEAMKNSAVIQCYTDPDAKHMYPVKHLTGAQILTLAASYLKRGLTPAPGGFFIDAHVLPLDMAMVNPAMNSFMVQLQFENIMQSRFSREEKSDAVKQMANSKFFRGEDVLSDGQLYATLYSSSLTYYTMVNEWTTSDILQTFGDHATNITTAQHASGKQYAGVIIDALGSYVVDASLEANLVLSLADLQELLVVVKI